MRMVGVAAAAFVLAAGGVLAGSPSWRVAKADVRVVCPLTLGGAFEAKTATLTGTLTLATARPLAFAGELSVDLRTLDTSIAVRDAHLRDEYLEVGRGGGFESAVLSDIRLGERGAETFEGRTSFTGSLLLHGVRKTIAGRAEIRREASGVRVEATFPVTLAEFGIKEPRYLGVGVREEVQVKVSLRVAPAIGPGEAP